MNNNTITRTKKMITDYAKKPNKLVKKGTILMSFKLSIGKMAIAGADLFTNEAIAGLVPKSKIINKMYLYYYLLNNKPTGAFGCIGNGSLNSESVAKIKIPVPSIELQKDIIANYEQAMNEYTTNYTNTIESLKKEIIMYQQLMKNMF